MCRFIKPTSGFHHAELHQCACALMQHDQTPWYVGAIEIDDRTGDVAAFELTI
jgi:hypothetical protein